VECAQLTLWELGVQLDLIDCRRHIRFGEQALEVGDLEVGNADRAYPAVGE
jgi:hypothetical protein